MLSRPALNPENGKAEQTEEGALGSGKRLYLIEVLRYMEGGVSKLWPDRKARSSWERENPALSDNPAGGMKEETFWGEDTEYQMKFGCILNTEGS